MNMRRNLTQVWRPGGAWLLSALALAGSSSCASSRWVARWEPSRRDHAPAVRTITPHVPAAQTTFASDSAIHHAVVDETSPMTSGIEQMSREAAGAEELATARSVESSGFVASGQSPEPLSEPIPFAPIPRMPAIQACPPNTVCPPAYGVMCPLEEPPYPEEILCDGGDAGHPFHYEGSKFAGLEAEDTVAEFTDHEGTAHVRISSQVCIYAPKFGSVRSISQPLQGYAVDALGGTHDGVGAAGFDHRRRLVTAESIDQLADTRTRAKAGGVDTALGEGALHQTLAVEQHIKLQNVFEDRNTLSEGQFEQATEAYLAANLQIAGVAIHDIGPIVVANEIGGQTVTSNDAAADYTGVEDRRTPGDLRVVKLADQPSAQPGDTITFRIRFYNDGDRELTAVRILDHLSPRLEYVEGSAISELEGRLTLEQDEYGGQILQFVLDAPLEGGKSGEISFQAVAK